MVALLDADQIRARPSRALVRLISHLGFQGRPVTTGWRWLNPLLFAHFGLVKRFPQTGRVKKPIFILGTGRSGTTILGKVLALHPHIGFLNEPKALWHAIYQQEDVIGNFTRGSARYVLHAEDVSPDVFRNAHRLYGYYASLTRSQRILDKYPEMIFRVSFLRKIFPDAKFIFLVRNGWDTVHSIAAWSRREATRVKGELHDWWGVDRRKWRLLVKDILATRESTLANKCAEVLAFTSQEDMAAVEWTLAMQEGLRLIEAMPELLLKVHYEELTAYPKTTLTNLLEFCELPEDDVFLSYAMRTLEPVPSRPSAKLSSIVNPEFMMTMKALGYSVGDLQSG